MFWSRLARRDERLVLIYIAALAGAFLGAKLVYFAAEGWLHWHDPNRWVILATGKSITGALLGGYLAVEIAKRLLRYHGITGDWFAVIAPVGIMLGRIGCMIQGCCLRQGLPGGLVHHHRRPRRPALAGLAGGISLQRHPARGHLAAALGPDCAGAVVSHLPDDLRHLPFLP